MANTKAPAAPEDFDFGALTPKATEVWASNQGREAKPVPENLLTALKSSKANDQAGLFTVPGPAFVKDDKGADTDKHDGHARALVLLLRRGAEQLNYGVRIKVTAGEGDKAAHVAFQAKDRRKHDESKPRKPTRRKDQSDTEYAALLAEYERALAVWKRENQ